MIAININQELLGKILAAKYINALNGNTSLPSLAKRIAYTVLPSGFIIRKKQ